MLVETQAGRQIAPCLFTFYSVGGGDAYVERFEEKQALVG